MVKVTPPEDAKEALKEILPKIPDRYARKVRKAKWKDKAASEEAERLWKEKLEEAAAAKRRKRGIERVSEEEWRKNALELGSKRIRESLEGRVDKWATKWKPYADALAAVELPPKSADFEENIANRVTAVVAALKAKKKEIYGE
ncbi:MAG: hypothetical protein NZ992_00725 [Candidatus Korarchaeum sp.]|nr:hypothetical protein [Candidatus Korarchaeum sp.]MDW8035520.1 hypothetical protein [Candidatus Korarchaeum sp.]